MENKLDLYVEKHLSRFIKYHLERGYSPLSVKKALMHYGYTHSEIDKITDKLHVNQENIHKRYKDKELEAETYYFLRGMIADYIKKQLDMKFNIKEIQEALINFGHTKSIVTDATNLVYSKIRVKVPPGIIFTFCFIGILIFIFMMSLTLETKFAETFRLFLPSIVSLGVSYLLIPTFQNKKEFIPIFSVIISIFAFFMIMDIKEDISSDSAVLLVLNVIIAALTSSFCAYLYVPKPKVHKQRKKPKEEKQENKKDKKDKKDRENNPKDKTQAKEKDNTEDKRAEQIRRETGLKI